MRHPFLRTLAATPTDPNFENVTLLLHGDGTNGGQNNTFVDGSTNNFTITRNGNTTQGTFSPYGDNWSVSVNGSSAYLTSANNANLALGNSDFTFECWVNGKSFSSTPSIFFSRWGGNFNYGYFISYDTSGLAIYYSTNGTGSGNVARYYGGTLTPGTWHHVAICRASGTMRGFIDGTQVGSSTSDNVTFYNSTAAQIVGGLFDGPTFFYPYNGLISNVRMVIGTALYTSNFSPSSTPLTAITNTKLLTCASNRFVDKSATSLTITTGGTPTVQRFSPFSPTAAYAAGTIGGSGYFDGTGDYLTVADNAAFGVGTGNFTIEAWIYLPVVSGTQAIVSLRSSNTGIPAAGNNLAVEAGKLAFSNGAVWTSGNTTLLANTWYHVAVTRSSGSMQLWLNGTADRTAFTDTSDYASSRPCAIGALGAAGFDALFSGYIANVRIVKGSAVYTTTFTPPTAPLTAITNTSLLLNFTNAAILDNAMMAVPETVGNAQIDTTTKKFGTGSLEFDGTGDYLVVNSATTDLYAFGSGNFTIEFWLYLNSTQSSNIIDFRPSGTEGFYPTIYVLSNSIRFVTNNADQITGSTLSNSVWYHIALCKSGTSTKLFVDGTQTGSTYSDSNSYLCASGRPYIGGSSRNVNTNIVNGFLDDLRITKGVARYTANFTAPTAAFPDL